MLKILLLFIIIQNVRTQHQNGCTCHKLSNAVLSQLLINSYLNSRPAHNVHPAPNNIGLSLQNGQLTSKSNGLNVNNLNSCNEFMFSSNLPPNMHTEAANDALKTNSLPIQIKNYPALNELLSHAISTTTSNVPTIKSSINNKLLNNGVQYNIDIQMDKKDLLNKIMKCAFKGKMEVPQSLGDTLSILNSVDTSYYNNMNMNQPINIENQYANTNTQSGNLLMTLHGIQENKGINYIENRALRAESPITNSVFNFETPIDKMQLVIKLPFRNQMYLQDNVDSQMTNRVMEQIIPVTNTIQATNQITTNYPNINIMSNDNYDRYINDAVVNTIPVTVSNPLSDTLITNTMPINNIQFDNNANTGNVYQPNLNIPNILLSDFISNNQNPLSIMNNGMPNVELKMANPSMQYEDITNLNGLLSNNVANTNAGEYNAQIPLNIVTQTTQISDLPIIGNLNSDQSLYNLPASMINFEESLGNIHLSMPTKLADFSILNLGQFGCLPIINGLPVAGITETVTVMNPNI